MRSVLFSIPLDGRLDLGPLGKVPIFGIGLAMALWCALGVTYLVLQVRRRRGKSFESIGFVTLAVWVAVLLAIFKAPALQSIPVYGYGTMLFLGFLGSASLAARRIRREGADGEIAWDVAMWLFVSGLLGARIYFIVTHPDRFFGIDPRTGQPHGLVDLINLPDGGLVLYGALILAPLAYWAFCRRRRVNPLALADIAIASVFVGIAFGRLGCLLHGCCYGDACSLPWAIAFPRGSVPFDALVARGYLSADAARSLALHPTQIYDALNGVLLALVTYVHYPFRRRTGEVLVIGWILYPINRFLIEFLRFDEPAVFGTPFTGAQLASLALFTSGVAFAAWLRTRPAQVRPLIVPADAPPGASIEAEPTPATSRQPVIG